MNKDQVKGRVKEVQGSVKEATGKLVGSTQLETKGKLEKMVGTVQAKHGDTKAAVTNALKKLG